MPEPFAPLDLEGYRGEPLPCLLHARGGESATAVVLPGGSRLGGRIGGTPARPDLRYTRALLQSLGLAVLEVWWRTDELREGAELESWLRENALAAVQAARERGQLRVVVSRSLGTMALARVLDEIEPARTVWFSPLVREAEVAEAIKAAGECAFVVAGAADPLWDSAVGADIRASGARLIELPEADHSLGVVDPARSARLLADVLDDLRSVLGATGVAP